MQKIIRDVDEKRGILQVTCSDERWYLKAAFDPETALPTYKAVPSATWVAGHYPKGLEFYKWLAATGWDEAQAIKEAAGDKGSKVHLAIEWILKGEEVRIDTKFPNRAKNSESEPTYSELSFEELLCVKSFIDWRADIEKDYIVDTLANETTVYSDIHNVAGTVDFVARLTPKEDGKNPLKLSGPTPYVIDFKTGKNIWREYEIQLSTYRTLLENGENPIMEKNPNGTETGKVVDLSGLRTAILQVGYTRNKAGYKFTEIEDAFALFLVAQQIWKREAGSQEIKQYTFPVVLSAGDPKVVGEEVSVDEAMAAEPVSEQVDVPVTKTKKTK